MRRYLIALLFSLVTVPALSQSSPNLARGQVPTAAQWNSFFTAKQDILNFTPVNKAGDIMAGPLVTAPSSALQAGLVLPHGSAPTSPADGSLWTTILGLYAQINGSTVGPYTVAGIGSFAASNPLALTFPSGVVTYGLNYNSSLALDGSNNLEINPANSNIFTAAQTINLNAVALPPSITGATLNLGAADGVVARAQLNAFGAIASFTGAVYGGTNASRLAVTSGTQLTGINAYAYNGSALVGPVASFRTYAAENIASGHQGSYACIATTPTASTTSADGLCQQNDGGITIGSPTGGSKGGGTINSAGGFYSNGTLLAVAGTSGYIQYNASGALAGVAGFTFDGTAKVTLGVISSTTGTLTFHNTSTGTITLSPPTTGALGAVTLTLPAVTDTVATIGTANQAMTGGVALTPYDIGTASSGTKTINCGNNPVQKVINGGAFTLAAPASNDGTCMILVTNNASAGAITFSGFTVGSNTGDALDTTNGHYFTISVWRINSISSYVIKAMQ